MLEPWKLHLNFYFLCFSFHFLFFFSFYVVSAFMRPLMLFDPLMGEVSQITPPCCLSLISTSRSPGSHDLLEVVRRMSSLVPCIIQSWGRTRDYVRINMAILTPLPFLRLLERALWEWHILHDLAVFTRKIILSVKCLTNVNTRYSSQYAEQVPYFSISVNFPFTGGKHKPVVQLSPQAEPHLASCCSLQNCWCFPYWGWSPSTEHRINELWLSHSWRKYSGNIWLCFPNVCVVVEHFLKV